MASKYSNVPRPLTDEDKLFIKLLHEGKMPRSKAFLTAYPNHPHSKGWLDVKYTPEAEIRRHASRLLVQAAKDKVQTQRIKNALVTFNSKMEEFSEASLETAVDLVKNARSEKVRADLAIEGIRHKVGTPVQKIAVKEEKTVYLTFTEPPKERTVVDVPEAEVVQ